MHTRKEYMSGDCTHQQFYEQMVTDEIKEGVRKSIGLGRIMHSTCEHFNDIPLSFWDTLGWNLSGAIDPQIKAASDHPSLAGRVCVVKAAAKMLKREEEDLTPYEVLKRMRRMHAIAAVDRSNAWLREKEGGE
tara:strand:- start:2053 stop:2451 length:399 start_codon:yes stop_codon:yes gene_type:complete